MENIKFLVSRTLQPSKSKTNIKLRDCNGRVLFRMDEYEATPACFLPPIYNTNIRRATNQRISRKGKGNKRYYLTNDISVSGQDAKYQLIQTAD